MSFVLDTGAPKIYFCEYVFGEFIARGVIVEEPDMGVTYIKLFGRKYIVELTPEGHAPANIIGLKALCALGSRLHNSPDYCYSLSMDPAFLSTEEIL